MTLAKDTAEAVLASVLAAPQTGKRKLVALAGPPASGKTTLSEGLARRLTQAGCKTVVIPMDGFHLDNEVLSSLGLLDKKGAPETFDVSGFVRLVQALRDEDRVFYPTFDRQEDFARACAGLVDAHIECVIVEGNYLLFDAPVWRDLATYWDLSIRLNVPLDVLRERLVQRWIDFGLTRGQAEQRAAQNDLANARLVSKHALPASLTL